MPIQGFDYKAFAIDLSKQAEEILNQSGGNASPDSLSEADKKNIVDTVRKFCHMCGEALSNDPQLKFNAEQASLVTQFIGEWTFHKSIDLINGKIPQQNRDSILQIIAANIFNTAKLAIIKKMPQDALINLIEDKVKQVYSDELQKLVKKGALSQTHFEQAVNQSNLNDMVQKTEAELNTAGSSGGGLASPKDKKVLKLAALAIVLRKLPQETVHLILNSLGNQDAAHVVNYMKMSNLEEKIDRSVILRTLEEIKKIIPTTGVVSVPRLLQRFRRNLKTVPPQLLSRIAMNEREAVKDFILDEKFPAEEVFSSSVIQALVTSVEDKINDYQEKVHKR